ncbi:MAG TPA: helix-turn-helix domain-containing protein [Labilithrix sp.]|nr:helix-turn-helix domain-containing protein [Labilithrix sp.]
MSRVADPTAKIALLRAAEEVFADRGVSGAKVEEIAHRAGLSKGAFYLHFESKDAALKQIVETWLARCASLFGGPVDYPDVAAEPDALLDFCIERDVQIYEFFWQSRTTMRILQTCQGDYHYMFEAFRSDMLRNCRQWLEQWQCDGWIRSDTDVELAATLMSGAYEALSLKMIKWERRPPFEGWLEFAQSTFMRAFGTAELLAALERRNERVNTGIHELPRSAHGSGMGASSSRQRSRVRGRG